MLLEVFKGKSMSETLRQAIKKKHFSILKQTRGLFWAIYLSPQDKRKRRGRDEDDDEKTSWWFCLSVCLSCFHLELRHFCMPHNRRRTGRKKEGEKVVERRTLLILCVTEVQNTKDERTKRGRARARERERWTFLTWQGREQNITKSTTIYAPGGYKWLAFHQCQK